MPRRPRDPAAAEGRRDEGRRARPEGRAARRSRRRSSRNMSTPRRADAARGHGVHGPRARGASSRSRRAASWRSCAASRRPGRSRSSAAARAPTTSSSPRPEWPTTDHRSGQAGRHAPARRRRRPDDRGERARASSRRQPPHRRGAHASAGLNGFLERARRQGAELVAVAREQAEAIAASAREQGFEAGYDDGHAHGRGAPSPSCSRIAEQHRRARSRASRDETLAALRARRSSSSRVQLAEKILQRTLEAEPERVGRRAAAARCARRSSRDGLTVVCNPDDLQRLHRPRPTLAARRGRQLGRTCSSSATGASRAAASSCGRTPGDVDATIDVAARRACAELLLDGRAPMSSTSRRYPSALRRADPVPRRRTRRRGDRPRRRGDRARRPRWGRSARSATSRRRRGRATRRSSASATAARS